MAFQLNFDFGSLFGGKKLPLVGLDIGNSGVRLIELSGTGKNVQVECFAFEPLPRNAVVDGNIENMEQVQDAVSRVWKKSGTRTKHVALAMPGAMVITKKIVLPSDLSEDNMEIQVENEAGQYIPFSMDEVSLDFDVIGTNANSPDDVDVMLAATRREKVEDRVNAAEEAGLKPTVMDVESYAARSALERVTHKANRGQIIALFQIGSSVTQVFFMQDGEVLYEREFPFGGNQLTQDIARNYGLSHEDAEAKKKNGDLPDGWQAEVLEPFFDSAAQEVSRSIQFFFTSSPYTEVHQLFLAGGCAAMPGLAEKIAEYAKVPTVLVNPFANMKFGSNVREKQLLSEAPAYLVACGLALRRFD